MVKEDILLESITSKDKRINIRVSENLFKRLHNLKKGTGIG